MQNDSLPLTNYLLQQLPSPVAVFKGENFAIELANDKLLEIWGKKAHEVLHQPYFNIFPQSRQNGLEEKYLHVYQTGQPYVREAVPTAYERNGQPVEEIYKIVLTPVRDSSGCIEGIMATGYDITAEVKARKNSEAREAMSRTVLESSPDCVKVLDSEGRLEYMNYNGLCIMEIDDFNRVEGLQWWKLWPVESQKIVETSVQKAFNGMTTRFQAFGPTAKGSPKWWDVVLAPVASPDGAPTQLISFSRDITGQKIMLDDLNKKLREISEYKYALDESSIVAITDQKGVIQYVNDQFCKISKYSREELLGQDHRLINSGCHAQEYIRNLWVTIANGKIWKGELKNKAKDGSYYWVDTTIVPFLNEQGKPYQYIAIRSDITPRKEAEQQLHESEEKMRFFIDYAPASVAMFDNDMRYLAVSQRWMQDYKLETNIIGQSHYAVFPEIPERWKEIHRNALAGSVEISEEDRFERADGTTNWIKWEVRPWYNARGAIGGIVVSTEDVTEHKRAREATLKRNEQLNLLARIAQTLILSNKENDKQLQSIFEDVCQTLGLEMFFNFLPDNNSSLLRLNTWGGLTPEEASSFATIQFGEYFCGRVAQYRKHIIAENILEVAHDGSDGLREAGVKAYVGFPLIAGDRLIGTLAFATRHRAHFFDGEVQIIQAACDQIAATLERDRLNNELQESEEQYRSAFENAAVGVSHVGPDGSWLLVNERFCQITGYTKEEMLQLTFQQITHPDDLYIDMTFVQEVMEDKRENYSMEKRYIRKDGSAVWVNLSVSAVRYPDRSIKHFISVVENINARKTAEIALKESETRFRNLAVKLETLVKERTKELAEANKELQRSNEDLLHFAHVASHDLKEPIRKIRTFQDRLNHEFEAMLPDIAKFYLSKIGVAARRSQDMIEGILLYSSLNQGDHKRETVDLNKVLENIKTDLEVLIIQKEATIDYDELPELEGYAELLNQLLYNLLANSLKFTKPGLPPVIKVSGSLVQDNPQKDAPQTKRMVQLTVQDNGIGFPQEFADGIFDTFSRLHSKDKYEGSGLGLALCKRVAERHGGYIKAEGKEGEGATFKIFLPEKQEN